MIDIRELRINSHVLLKGERVEVEGIDNLRELVGLKGFYVEREGERFHLAYRPQDLDPIPLTEELLKELGFRNEYGDFYKDLGENLCLSLNHAKAFIIWEVRNGKFVNDLASMDNCRYLHELEAFVYLTTKQELI